MRRRTPGAAFSPSCLPTPPSASAPFFGEKPNPSRVFRAVGGPQLPGRETGDCLYKCDPQLYQASHVGRR